MIEDLTSKICGCPHGQLSSVLRLRRALAKFSILAGALAPETRPVSKTWFHGNGLKTCVDRTRPYGLTVPYGRGSRHCARGKRLQGNHKPVGRFRIAAFKCIACQS